jgi:hypothetical protein
MQIHVSCAGNRVENLLNRSENFLTGYVHSSFQKAVNLLLQTSEGEHLLALLASDAHPWGLTCPRLPEISARFRPGMTWIARQGQMAFPSEKLELRLREVPRWKPPPVEGRNFSDLRGNLLRLRKISFDARPAGSLNFLERCAEARIRGIAGDWSDLTLLPEGWAEQLFPLIGLGPGLTPLGDDFVSGYLAAANLLAPSDGIRRELQKGSVSLAAGETTFYSKHQILFAGHGICLRSIFLLIQSLTFPAFDESSAIHVLNIGATSGCGWLSGILTAASQVCRRAEVNGI